MDILNSHLITAHFFNEIQKTFDIGRAIGYNMDECFDRVKEIVESHMNR